MPVKSFDQGGRTASAFHLPKLSKRLAAVAALAPEHACVADIGTDHGYLAVWLYLTGAKTVIAADINKGPLDSAKRTAAEFGVDDKIIFSLSDGFQSIDTSCLDSAVLAGMGGETIIDIITALHEEDRRKIRLILQPQSKLDELCESLAALGYDLIDANITKDAGRVYIIFSVKWCGTNGNVDPLSLLSSRGGELILDYLEARLTRLEKELSGHVLSGRTIEADSVRVRLEHMRQLLK